VWVITFSIAYSQRLTRDSLVLHAGIHPLRFGFHRLVAKRFPYAVYYRIISDTYPSPSWIETNERVG